MQREVIPNIVPVTTAAKMVEMIKAGAQSTEIMVSARNLVRFLGDINVYPIQGKMSEIAAVYDYVLKNVRYTLDPDGVEYVSSPARIQSSINKMGRAAGDCDDIACIVGAYLKALGHKVRIVLVAFNPKAEFQHVFIETYVKNVGWLTVDPSTYPNTKKMLRDVKRTKFLEV